MIYSVSSQERARLLKAIRVALAVPFIAGVEGFVWEAIFHYVKKLEIPNPHSGLRKKLLFDVVSKSNGIGWSLKSHQGIPSQGSSFEVVIQRADIMKKRAALGFPKINLHSQPQLIGEAVLAHWRAKVNLDSAAQKVKSPRVAILLKSRNHREYALHEEDMTLYSNNDLTWSWTDKAHDGLQARRKDTGRVVYRWYPNQKQLFEVFTLSKKSFRFHIESTRIDASEFVESLSGFLK